MCIKKAKEIKNVAPATIVTPKEVVVEIQSVKIDTAQKFLFCFKAVEKKENLTTIKCNSCNRKQPTNKLISSTPTEYRKKMSATEGAKYIMVLE